MLRSHVQKQFLFALGTRYAKLGAKGVFLLVGDFALNNVERWLVQSRDEIELAAPATAFSWEILSQRVPLGIILRQQNAPEIGMAGKVNAHHVVHFAFQELSSLPDSGERRNRRVVLRDARFEAKTLLKGERVQVVDDFEPQLIFRIVDRADIREMVERCIRRIVQVARNLQQA